jgi:hypothetical protein
MYQHETPTPSDLTNPLGDTPVYQNEDGKIAQNPLSFFEGQPPRFSLHKLALYLSPPALVGEFHPDSPWAGITRLRPHIDWPEATSNPADICTVFRKNISDCIGSASTVAVAASGGLDSTAVLIHAGVRCKAEGRRLIAIVVDLVDDNEEASGKTMQHLADRLEIPCEVYTIDGASMQGQNLPVWDPHGPRGEALPHLGKAVSDLAERLGAEVLLSGSGSDELLGTGRYLLFPLLRDGRLKDAFSYLDDLASEGGTRRIATEVLSLLARFLPKKLATQLYWATNWPELCNVQPNLVLAEAYRESVGVWSAEWLRQILLVHEEWHGKNWALADAWDAVFPADILPKAGAVPKKYPFLTPDFVKYAMGLPLTRRYTAHLPTPYHRGKALVLRLYPPSSHSHLPRRKQVFAKAFGAYQLQTGLPERCLALGLLDAEAFTQCNDPVLRWRIHALEQWIRGAEQIGAKAVE